MPGQEQVKLPAPASRVTGRHRRPSITPLAGLLVVAGCTVQTGGSDALTGVYQRSIAAAAVKQPDYARPLQPIDTSRPKVTMAHIQPFPTIDTSRFTWVTSPDELRVLCQDRSDPLLALQQALGLPPEPRADVKVFTFEVRPKDLFRPCASSTDITTTQCSIDLPEQPVATQAAADHFVLKQIMDSYRSGFKDPGYPFTAMGWSYDWNPESPTHQGVSEYVVRPGAALSNVASVDPATFCQPPPEVRR
jgi:hypothetical protein